MLVWVWVEYGSYWLFVVFIHLFVYVRCGDIGEFFVYGLSLKKS